MQAKKTAALRLHQLIVAVKPEQQPAAVTYRLRREQLEVIKVTWSDTTYHWLLMLYNMID